MFFTPPTEQFSQTARTEFEQLQHASVLGQVWSTISGRERRLLRLEEVKQSKQIRIRSDVGIQTVAISSIHGSESRNRDFDREWRPLQRVNQKRWINVAVAHLSGVPLPAVDLIKVEDGYFVRDGDHRISVAKHQGQIEIEANVAVWHVSDKHGLTKPSKQNHAPYLNQHPRSPFRQAFAIGAARLSKFAGARQREINLPAFRLDRRPQKPYNSGTTA